MTTANLSNHRKEVIEATQQLVATGIMTKSLHGNISMRVPGQDAFLLTAGGSLAIVGRTGSGKSTLAKLLARLLATPPGTVFIDGVDESSYLDFHGFHQHQTTQLHSRFNDRQISSSRRAFLRRLRSVTSETPASLARSFTEQFG